MRGKIKYWEELYHLLLVRRILHRLVWDITWVYTVNLRRLAAWSTIRDSSGAIVTKPRGVEPRYRIPGMDKVYFCSPNNLGPTEGLPKPPLNGYRCSFLRLIVWGPEIDHRDRCQGSSLSRNLLYTDCRRTAFEQAISLKIFYYINPKINFQPHISYILMRSLVFLKPTGHVMHQQFNIQQL